MWNDKWPFLSDDPEVNGTANRGAWEQYFLQQLGGYPASYQLFRHGIIRYFNLPEAKPELFDTSYNP